MKHTRPRYIEPWLKLWDDRVARELRPGIRILDVGSGRRPAIPFEGRPLGCRYVGLDLSLDELLAAPDGTYDEVMASDVLILRPEFVEQFDLVLSWQVLEHVKPLATALDNIRHYLVPGGVFLAHLSGRFSLFGLMNQAVPHGLAVRALRLLLAREPKTIFPAHYDGCWYSALVRSLAGWSERDVLPRYRGSGYFRFFEPLERAYLVYEDWTVQHRNLATHYLISARR
jgi:SAM-dependent methyltransferase